MTELNLASGASYFRSPDAAITAATAAIKSGQTYYGPAEGSPELREAIAKRYTQDGINVSPEQILVTPGTKQALFNLCSVLLHDEDEVVIPVPAWFGFNELLKYSKGKLVTIQTTPETNYNLDVDALRQVLTDKSRLLLLTNPANPTGRIYSKQELEAILALLHDYPNLYLISDEIYDLDTYSKPFTSALSCAGPQERVIVVNGFSKNFAMSGWRIGYMVAPADVIRQSIDFQSSTFSGVSMFIQEAALATIQHSNEALAPMLEVLKEHRKIMQKGLEAIPHVSFYIPDGAYYFFPDLRYYIGSTSPDGTSINSTEDLCDYLQHKHNLIVVNGDKFGGIGHVRMSFAVERHILELAMVRLKEALLQVTFTQKV
ncbi:aminotransferase class I/II-fold pyridoxal phosphate-dependent enzyme [Pontibacter sp. KCTC 32443]|uniref:aminotransferase class I/II-fold pyridoxal phosphate-dependent enzyme n=1 Tax=Pontibacter TaxID=323449 RepID=UPI00164E858E|nr:MULTISPECIES: aminotransferase class I/II-fold pyridoxal phosphate-dependent enzyme [Pontibacter]MBC5773192.1 aminotransferase class I/II-fold pyridoxal phosphate-dependent enzyme [Pontibacter sp. KCTC 32443]